VIRGTQSIVEIAILSVLILATRCANYQDVFVAGNIYFTDADCYARMTRVRMCSEHPGLIVRHHDFENFPAGTTPHTTAPLDYLVLALSIFLKPFTAQAIDVAGALISPLLALLGGWFLWWWSKRIKLRYRWMMLILYAISPILVHGTELGRPDHQSVLIVLVAIAICAEWSLQAEAGSPLSTATGVRSKWSVLTGVAWGLAICRMPSGRRISAGSSLCRTTSRSPSPSATSTVISAPDDHSGKKVSHSGSGAPLAIGALVVVALFGAGWAALRRRRAHS